MKICLKEVRFNFLKFFLVDVDNIQPFVIGYFKEEIYDDDERLDDTKNKTKSGSSKVMINPRDLFTKDFIKMKHPKVRINNKVKGEFD
jgi:hypothetical protein